MTDAAGADLAGLEARALRDSLTVLGALETRPEDGIGDGTLVLLGPSDPGFWAHVSLQPEFRDGQPDPMDRWSGRVITALAGTVGGTPYFPFGDPVRPFISWALRSGRAWQSPVSLLVHDRAGLLVSYRGAILLPGNLEPQPEAARPCEACAAKPCLTACPVSALTGDGYDLDACHAFLDTTAGQDCMTRGCRVRRSCPLSTNYGRSEQQSAFHMEHFHPWPLPSS